MSPEGMGSERTIYSCAQSRTCKFRECGQVTPPSRLSAAVIGVRTPVPASSMRVAGDAVEGILGCPYNAERSHPIHC